MVLRTAPEAATTKTKRFKEESRSAGQHSPNTATFSIEATLHPMRSSSNDTRLRNMDTLQTGKEQASCRTKKDGKKYVKSHRGWVRKTNNPTTPHLLCHTPFHYISEVSTATSTNQHNHQNIDVG